MAQTPQDKPANPQQKQTSAPVPAQRGAPGQLARPRAYDLWSMSPFALMRRMLEETDVWGGQQQQFWSPKVDVLVRDNNLVVRADIPGVNRNDIKVELTDDGLLIEGERKFEQQDEGTGFRRFERSYGSFQRLIPLPDGIDAAQAQANFENGVLEVIVPMPSGQKDSRRRIEVREKSQGGTKAVH
jgi:HSP20 family protein